MGGKKKGGNQGGDNGDNKNFSFDFNSKEKAPILTKEQTDTLMPFLQKQLETSILGKSSGYLESLPVAVQTRIKALKYLQTETDKLEDEFKKEEEALIKKYEVLKNPLFIRRDEIVNGKSEPKAEEIVKKDGEEEIKSTSTSTEEVKGIPEFWLIALKHNEDFGDLITDEDEPALQHLTNVTAIRFPNEDKPTPSFILNFHFTPNDYFENDVIFKKYILTEEGGDMMFDHTESSEIKWKSGKNLTKKMVTKTQKVKGGRGGRGGRGGKGGNATKTVTVEEDCASFFRFFAPDPSDDEVQDEQDLQDFMESDYELGLSIKDEFIPNAVNFFTGDIPKHDYEDDGEGDDDDEEEDEDEEDDEEAPPTAKKVTKIAKGKGKNNEESDSEEDEDFDPKSVPQGQQPECKQQ